MRRTRMHWSREAGDSLLSVLLVMTFVTIVMSNFAVLGAHAALAARRACERMACRTAAEAIFRRPAPAADGEWTDLVCGDLQTGALGPVSTVPVPPGATAIRRTWRARGDGSGARMFEARGELLEADAASPRSGAEAATVSLVRVAEDTP